MPTSSVSRRHLLQSIGAGSVLMLAGCNMMKAANLKAPEVRVANVTLGRFDLSGLQVMVDLHLRNPNDVDLPITGLEYNLILQGVTVADGRQEKSQTLPALGETDMRLGLNVNLLSSAAQLVPMFLNPQGAPKSLDYKVGGSVKLDWWYMPAIAFNRAGSVPLAGMPSL